MLGGDTKFNNRFILCEGSNSFRCRLFIAAMARSLADEALSGYSPPTPMPNTKSEQLMTGNNVEGMLDRKILESVKQMAPNAMNEAVIILPFLLPMVLASEPTIIMPAMTPSTTAAVAVDFAFGERLVACRECRRFGHGNVEDCWRWY